MQNTNFDTPAVVLEAIRRWEECADWEKQNRKDALDDLLFYKGEQWDPAIRRAREAESKPCLTIPRLQQFVSQVTNEERQNRPAVKVSPVSDGADQETAEVLQGMVRHIEYESDADAAYDTAGHYAAVTGGPGWVRVDPQPEDPNNIDGPQILTIGRVRNNFQVYDDPRAIKADRSDSRYRFFIERISKQQYKADYPDSGLASLDDWSAVEKLHNNWVSDSDVQIAEYFYFDDGAEDIGEQEAKGKQDPKPKKKYQPKLWWIKFNAIEELDRTEILSPWIPSAPCFGHEIDIDGKPTYKGVVRDAKDAQRMFNYMATLETESVMLAPKAPYVMAAGQQEGFEEMWNQANNKNLPYLLYNPQDVNGKPVPPPQRNVQEPPVVAISQARAAAAEDMKAVTGIYDASLGARSNEQTGKAILARQQQGQIANFHYLDNLTRCVRHIGRIVIKMIPKYYTEARIVRTVKEDGEAALVHINGKSKRGRKSFDLGNGDYDVTVSTGPSYDTKRQQMAAMMLDLFHADPQLMPILGDIFVGTLDIPGGRMMADRLKKALPQQFQDSEDNSPEMQVQRAQAQLAQMQQAHQALNAYASQLEKEKEGKIIENQFKAQIAQMQEMSRQEIVRMQEATKLSVAQINASKDANQTFAEQELAQYKIMHEGAHDVAMAHIQHGHAMEQAQQQADNAQAQQMTQIGADQAAAEQAQQAQPAQ